MTFCASSALGIKVGLLYLPSFWKENLPNLPFTISDWRLSISDMVVLSVCLFNDMVSLWLALFVALSIPTQDLYPRQALSKQCLHLHPFLPYWLRWLMSLPRYWSFRNRIRLIRVLIEQEADGGFAPVCLPVSSPPLSPSICSCLCFLACPPYISDQLLSKDTHLSVLAFFNRSVPASYSTWLRHFS